MIGNKYDQIFDLLLKFFKTEELVKEWFITPNINFGGATPLSLIQKGRSQKVASFVNSAADENGWK